MTKKEYNGWSNYETWNCKLWLDNDEWVHNDILSHAQHAKGYTNKEQAVADFIKDYVEGNVPKLDASMYLDMLNASISEINFQEIANAFLDEAE